ncbi:MAG TPA: PAS domain S-box protein [Burkholderiales bacterium]|nr:PAS domain S-box protein [Burkholderiales bacterium]
MADDSRHKQDVARLRESEITLQQILDNSTTVRLFAKDLAGRYLFVNRAFEQHVGRPAAEILGLTPGDIAPAEIAAGLRANDRHVIETGSPLEIEETNVIRGERRTLLANKFPLLDADGRPYAVCGISIDITERKRNEEALRRAALAVSTAAGPQVFETLVRQLSEILGVGAAMIAVYFDAERTHMRSLAACFDGRILKRFEYQVAKSPCAGVVGQEFRYVREGVHPEFAPDTLFADEGFDSYAAYSLTATSGEQLGLIVVMDRRPLAERAVTEAMLKIFAVRAAAEIERARADEALRASEASYRSIFEAAEDAIFVHDWDTGRILDVSPKATELFGHSREALRDLRVGDVSANVPPYTEHDAMRMIQKAKVRAAPLRFEWQARHKDGHLMWHEVTLKRATIAGEPRILAFVRDVTERKRAEEAVRASEEQYRAIFNASADALALRDADFRVVDVNPAMLAMTGFTREEAVGSTRMLFTPAKDHEAARRLFDQELRGEATQYEAEAVRKDGTRFAVEVRGVPMQYRGQPHVLVIARDVTERKRAEEAVRASEEQYRAIFNASADALVLWNSELRRVDVNPAYERLYGFAREEVLNTRYPDHLPLEYVERRRELVRRTLAGEPCQVELEALHKSGQRLHVEVRTIPVRHRGEPHVLAVVRDVTQRKLAEKALRASEEQYRAIFNASVDGLLLWDAEHRIVDVNEAFLSMHGYRRDELIGESRPVFIPADLQAQCADLLPGIIAGAPCRLEGRGVRKDGTEFDVEIHGIPMQYQERPHVLIILRDITEAKRAAERLRASEHRYRLLFEMESDAILVVDAESLRLLDANRAAESLWGYGRSELLAMTAVDLSAEHESTRDSIQLPDGRIHIPLRYHRRRDGTVFPIEITANRLYLDGRKTVIATVRDITERKRAEDALRLSEEQYRAVFNASADALVLRDASNRIVDVNPALLAMTGASREALVGASRWAFLPPEMHQAGLDIHRRVLGGEHAQFETAALRADGAPLDVEVRCVPIQYRGEPHVLAIARDVTERKRADELLRTSGEQYRAIFDASADALVLRDGDFRIVDVNPAYEAMTGYRRAEVIGADRVIANPPGVDALVKTLHKQALAGEPIQLETQIVGKDGRGAELELRGIPIRHQGKPHVLYVGRDITARKQAEAGRLALEAQLRQAQKMEAIGQLTGGIAHDFNNILTSIVGYVTLAAEREIAAGDPKLAGYLEQATRSCRRARDLIQQMLTFSRGQRGERRPTDLRKLVAESARLLRSSMPATLDLDTASGGDVPLAALDLVQAEQVLLNLCINARDALEGEGRVQVGVRRARHAAVCASCRCAIDGEFVELAVSDDGPGIAPEVMERIFEPFFSTKEVGKGSGMGLAMVHGIVHDHGGHVLVDTRPGEGTTFRILFPALRTVGPDPEYETLTGFAPAARRTSLRGRVLLVDDEEMVRGFMRELLEGWGLEVAPFGDGAEARAAFARAPDGYDLAITDQTMPRLTGMAFARELLALRPALPVILYSGYADALTEAQVRDVGIRALIRKPVEPAALRALLETLLPAATRAA